VDDVTDLLQTYQESARHVYNTYFRYLDLGEQRFWKVDDVLFQTLVLEQLGVYESWRINDDVPLPYLRVVPIKTPKGIPALWRHAKPSLRWTLDETRLHADHVEIHFIGYFDWAVKPEYKGLNYYQGRIISYPLDSSLEGADVFIEITHAKVFFTNEQQTVNAIS